VPAGGASAAVAAKKTVSVDPGALIRLNMTSTVGLLLDEIPAGPLREQAAAEALARPASFWTDRAARQVRLTYYRLVFRQFFYSADFSNNPHGKGPLPLPPKDAWSIALGGPASRTKIAGHDLVVADYGFSSYILTDAVSPGIVEPRLATAGGTWDESFTLPVDPELLLERTGFACMDEDEYPPNSVFEENTHYFYDDTCHVETENTRSCHITTLPKESCKEALTRSVGQVKPTMRFTRVAWDEATATVVESLNVYETSNPSGSNLIVNQSAMQEENRIVYRYIAAGSCEDQEFFGSPGWKRLLTFSAVAINTGTDRIHIGDVSDPSNPFATSNLFQFSPCHQHYHFSLYARFDYNSQAGRKLAFCLEDTNRFLNTRATPLTAEHQSCAFQGIGAGWGDEYQFGIPGQWVDITGVSTTAPHPLTFHVNPDQVLCEGTPIPGPFVPTGFFTSPGFEPILKENCNYFPGWDNDNTGIVSVQSLRGSFVTEGCLRGQTGPLRNCEFQEIHGLHSAPAGSTVRLSCTIPGAASAQVLRVCEVSEALGVGVACTLRDSLANVVVLPSGPTSFSFQSPAVRDTSTPGTGGYSLYQGSVLPSQSIHPVTCTAF
jgi:hypothetical protein